MWAARRVTLVFLVIVILVVEPIQGWGFPDYVSEEHHHHHHHHHVHHQHHGWERPGYVYEVPKVRLTYPFEEVKGIPWLGCETFKINSLKFCVAGDVIL